MPGAGGVSVMVNIPAGTSIGGEQRPTGTTIGPILPGLTVKVKLPVMGAVVVNPSLQISRYPPLREWSRYVTSVTPGPILTETVPLLRFGGTDIFATGTTSMFDTASPYDEKFVSAIFTIVPTLML
jgi:hypothetical protein